MVEQKVVSTARYSVDFSKEPGWIDFIVSDGKTRRVEGLIRFIDDNTVEIVYNYGSSASRLI